MEFGRFASHVFPCSSQFMRVKKEAQSRLKTDSSRTFSNAGRPTAPFLLNNSWTHTFPSPLTLRKKQV